MEIIAGEDLTRTVCDRAEKVTSLPLLRRSFIAVCHLFSYYDRVISFDFGE